MCILYLPNVYFKNIITFTIFFVSNLIWKAKKKSSYQHNSGSTKRKMREKKELEKVKNNPKQYKLNFNLTIENPFNVSASPSTNSITSESTSTLLSCAETEPSLHLLPHCTTIDFNSKSNPSSNTESKILTASSTAV